LLKREARPKQEASASISNRGCLFGTILKEGFEIKIWPEFVGLQALANRV
jgi:hypothetical protein